MSLQQAQYFVSLFDRDGNGALDYNEFVTAMQQMQMQQQQAMAMSPQPMMGQPVATAQPGMAMAEPMAQPSMEPQIACANGILSLHGRVQTQWDEGPGCDYRYYLGNVTAITGPTTATITYDDQDVWSGEAKWMYCVPTHHPGYARSDGGIGYATLSG